MEEAIVQSIKEFNKPLLQEKVLLKYKALAEGPYRFFRGTCHLFYEDLSKDVGFPRGPAVWASGDMHLENFGSFKSNNHNVYFDLNDFDESLLAPACWEVVRMTTSILVAFFALQIPEEKAMKCAILFLDTYCHILAVGKAKHLESRLAEGIVKEFLDQVSKRKNTSLLKKHVVKKRGAYRFCTEDNKHIKLDKQLKEELMDHIMGWQPDCGPELASYNIVDSAFRIAGTGSLGVERYVLLLQHKRKKEKYLILDMKESRLSSLQRFVSIAQPFWHTEAEREVTIQSLCQYANAALLSTTQFKGNSFVIQELQPEEDKINLALIARKYKDVKRVIKDMAWLAASAQLRSSGRKGSAIADELVNFGFQSDWQAEVLQYATFYAKKVKADYAAFLDAYKRGAFENGPCL
jgi:uncharacterized protein (DUF2252 family)